MIFLSWKLWLLIILLTLAGYFYLTTPLYEGSLSQVIPFTSTQTPPRQEFDISTPSLEQIFSQDHFSLQSLPSSRIRILLATGDIIPARSVNFQAVSRNNFLWPYEKVADQLKKADITFANLESPLFLGCQPTQTGMVFCGDSKHVEGLNYGGVDIVSLANNHAGNYGQEGINKTVKLLNDQEILVTGYDHPAKADCIGPRCTWGGPVIKDVRGLKFAFLGYNDVTSPQPGVADVDTELRIKLEIEEAEIKGADVIIVTFHWGDEYVTQPTLRQQELAHLAIDSGADLIIGNHPHWIQPVEIYKGKVITYAHGNFIFDQMWSQKTREGVLGKYTFFDNKLVDVQFFPLQIDDYGQPYFVEGEQKDQILGEMKEESLKLAMDND